MQAVREKSDTQRGGGMFPKDFLWGTSVCSYQVEGGNDKWSDWGAWNPRAGAACDFWNRYEEYLDLAKALGTNAFRFSIEWGRVNPASNVWNLEALERYKDMALAMKKRGLEPIVTLWHFTLPKWIEAQGGWSNRDAVKHFGEYVEKTLGILGGEARYWITLNEPTIWLHHGYITGEWPPGEKYAFFRFLRARSNLVNAHKTAYALIKKARPDSIVSVAANISFDEPHRKWHPGDRFLIWAMRMFGDYGFLKETADFCDFVGLNYYFHNRVSWSWNPLRYFARTMNENRVVSDLGWEIFPSGLGKVLVELDRDFRKPVIVAENGIADAADGKRPEFIVSHINAIQDAISRGADVRGYLHWSLVDNFEWAHGFGPRFGLYGMDYKKMQPHERGSCKAFRNLIRELSQN